MFSVRAIAVAIAVMSLLFLQNCAKNMELGADGLGYRSGQMLSASQDRPVATPSTYSAPDYDGLIGDRSPHHSKNYTQPTNFDEKNHFVRPGDKRESENSNAEMLPQPVPASIKAPSPDEASSPAANSRFLELLSDQDTENQELKRKTLICRGC